MCGIAGFYNFNANEQQIKLSLSCLAHRGPDGSGTFLRNDVGLIHTRLAIIELSELGAQPYRFRELTLVFNGELYNYREIRKELEARGYTFDSGADTEVVIKAFDCWKEACVERFIGMFAFAIYDKAADVMWLFRDRLGVKPLYYHATGSTLKFASELRTLEVLAIDRDIDRQSVYWYFRFGFIPGARSIYQQTQKLEAGCYLRMDKNGAVVKRYWNPSFRIDYSKSGAQWQEEIEGAMKDAFRYRMVADVPVGVFLSGGMDSSLLAAMLKSIHGSIETFTIGFKEKRFDELPFAQEVSKALGVSHQHRVLDVNDARKIFMSFYEMYDEPFADTSGVPVSFIARLAMESGVKVVLSADGGDELFGGYPHYQSASGLYSRMFGVPGVGRQLAGYASRVLFPSFIRSSIDRFNLGHKASKVEELLHAKSVTNFFEAYIANQSIEEINRLIGFRGGYLSQSDDTPPVHQMMRWDLQNYLTDDLLVKVDRATMFHGVECREPFLDHRLVELAMSMPPEQKMAGDTSKVVVRNLLSKYLPQIDFNRRKQGFSIPLYAWFSNELNDLFNTHLAPERVAATNILDPAEVSREFRKYRLYKSAGKEYNIEKMWRILSFMLWWDKHKNG